MYLLDTDHLTLLQRGGAGSQPLLAHLTGMGWSDVAATVISYEERTRGWMSFLAKARTPEAQVMAYAHLKKHLESYCAVPIVDFDQESARQYRQLQRLRLRCGTMDLKIAAIALANHATLVTRNRMHFTQVPDLRVEDWSV